MALKDVSWFLAEGHRFENENSQEFVKWQFAPNEVIVQRRACSAGQPPHSAATGHTSYNTTSASSVAESHETPAVSESDGLLAPSQQQEPADHHSMNDRSVDSGEAHQLRRAALSGAGSLSRQLVPANELEQPPNEQPPAVHRSAAT